MIELEPIFKTTMVYHPSDGLSAMDRFGRYLLFQGPTTSPPSSPLVQEVVDSPQAEVQTPAPSPTPTWRTYCCTLGGACVRHTGLKLS